MIILERSPADWPWQTVPGLQSWQDVNVSSGQRQSLSPANVKLRPAQCRAPSLHTSSKRVWLERSLAHNCREVLMKTALKKNAIAQILLCFYNLPWAFPCVKCGNNLHISYSRALKWHFTNTPSFSYILPCFTLQVGRRRGSCGHWKENVESRIGICLPIRKKTLKWL